jgi:hypothetical protein
MRYLFKMIILIIIWHIECNCCVVCAVTAEQFESPLSFCAVRNTNLTSGTSVLPFTSVPLNDGDAFDVGSNSFTVPSNSTGGYFWLTWFIGIPPSETIT